MRQRAKNVREGLVSRCIFSQLKSQLKSTSKSTKAISLYELWFQFDRTTPGGKVPWVSRRTWKIDIGKYKVVDFHFENRHLKKHHFLRDTRHTRDTVRSNADRQACMATLNVVQRQWTDMQVSAEKSRESILPCHWRLLNLETFALHQPQTFTSFQTFDFPIQQLLF